MSTSRVSALLLLNFWLQAWDGIATYHGLQAGFTEGNPLLRAGMAHYGVGWTLLWAKGIACGLLWGVRRLGPHPLIPLAFALLALVYTAGSVLPWGCLLLSSRW
jgi:Domain of unknown function (DUF5658)